MTEIRCVIERIAPQLQQMHERLWASESTGFVSYPTNVHARIAAIEDSSFWFRHRNRVITALVQKFPPTGLFFDVGGGNGAVSAALSRIGIPVVVVEPSYEGATFSCARGLPVIRAPFVDPDLCAPKSIAAVGLFDVIEHIPDDLRFLQQSRRMMCDGALLYVTVPALQPLWSSDDEYAGHFRRYNRRSLRKLLTTAGFEVLILTAFFSLLVPFVYFFRTMPTKLGLRRVTHSDSALEHHQLGRRTAMMMERLFDFEQPLVRRGYTLPMGTSLIAVARKTAD